MLKKLRYLVLILISFFPISVFAYELTCEEGEYSYNDTFECYLKGEVASYSSINGTLTHDDSLNCTKEYINDGIESLNNESNKISLKGTPANENFITFKCSVIKKITKSTNTNISITDFSYQKENDSLKKEILRSDYIRLGVTSEEPEKDDKPRDVSDPDTRLKTLISKDLNLTFSQFITTYYIEVLYETESVELNYTLNNPSSTVRINGNDKLIVGDNLIDIYVTNEAGTKETCYTLTVKRLARGEEIYYPERDSSLNEMTIPGYNINFDKNIYEYKVHLTSDISSIRVNAKATNDKAIISISSTDDLKNGSIVAVTVTSEDESNVSTYKINIQKDAPKKDYSSLIIICVLTIALIATIAMFIISAQKKKRSDPLLAAKKKTKKANNGEQFDVNQVPDTQQNQINTLHLDNTPVVAPVQNQNNLPNQINTNQSINNQINYSNPSPSPIVNPQSQPTINPNPPETSNINQNNFPQ